jgi:PAS domain S-box-containing protein
MNELFFAKAFEKSNAGMAFLQDDGKVISANPALARILDKDLWLVVGTGLGEHMNESNASRWDSLVAAFLGGRTKDSYFEAPFQPKETREAWWSLQLGDLGMEWSGRKVLFVLVEDITLKKVNERQLREARRIAESASRAKSEFLANVSHEIRTPLFTITGLIDLLLMGSLDRDQAHYARQIENAAAHLLDLLNDVLDFSKIEAGQMAMETIPFDLDDVLERSLSVVSLAAFRKGLELVLDLDPSVPRLWMGDPSRLRQILVNLLSNAVKFTETGYVQVRVRHQELGTAGREMVQFRVEDTGSGLSLAAEQSLFQVFSQGDSSTTRQYGGTGLGLAISQRLVRMLGGEIGYHSEPKSGTEFFFSVPLARGQDPELEWGNQGRNREIWLVDDRSTSRELLETALRWAGYRVRTAQNGAQLKALWADREGTHPSAILLDEDLGVEDAFELARWLKSESAAVSVPLLLLSVLGRPSVTSDSDGLFVFVLNKPVNPRVLVEVLTRGLDGLWQPRHSLQPPSSSPGTAPPQKPVRVAIAEDNDINRELFLVLLKRLGCVNFAAIDGEQILETVRTALPDIVFMDLQMPKLSGYEASIRLRREGVTCPIIAVTASAMKGELERCLRAGMNGVLTKPFKLDDLRDVLVNFLPGRGPFAVAQTLPAKPAPSVTAGPVIFDWDEAEAVFLGNRDLVLNLLTRFLPRTRETLQSLVYALDLGDLETVASAAHAIKGSALNLTAKALGGTAGELERAAREGQTEECSRLGEKLSQDFKDFEAVIAPFLK